MRTQFERAISRSWMQALGNSSIPQMPRVTPAPAADPVIDHRRKCMTMDERSWAFATVTDGRKHVEVAA